MKTQVMLSMLLPLWLLMSVAAHTSQSANMSMQVRVKPSCQIKSFSPIQWLPLVGTFPINIDNTTGSITTQCTQGIFYTVGINNGAHYDAATEMRRLSDNQGHFVNYRIYRDPAFSWPWQNIGTPYAMPLIGTGLDQISTLYARIPHGQPPIPAGSYSDALLVTIHF